MSLPLAQTVAVAMQEVGKGCARSVCSPLWVGYSREKLVGGREALGWPGRC